MYFNFLIFNFVPVPGLRAPLAPPLLWLCGQDMQHVGGDEKCIPNFSQKF